MRTWKMDTQCLKCTQNTSKITLKHMAGLMEFYKPKKSRRDVYLTFKHMNSSKTGALSLEEFYKIYETSKLSWKVLFMLLFTNVFFCSVNLEVFKTGKNLIVLKISFKKNSNKFITAQDES